jgi:hypothetical protein
MALPGDINPKNRVEKEYFDIEPGLSLKKK